MSRALQKHCYYLDYNAETRNESTFGDGSQPWMYFNTAEENQVSSTVKNILHFLF